MSKGPDPKTLDPRKIPTQTRAAETVRAILQAAAHILETRGLEAYTTNAVARRAGVSIGSLYQYFPGKDALTKALIQSETARLLEETREIGATACGRVALNTLIAAAVAHQLRRPALARLLDFEEARLPLGSEVEAVSLSLVSTLETILAKPDLKSVADPALAAQDLLAMVRGMVDAAGRRGETDAPALETRVRRAVFGYLSSPSGDAL